MYPGQHIMMQQSGINNPTEYPSNPSMLPGGYARSNMNCPPELEYLIPLENVFINQKINAFEVLIGYEAPNRYTIVDIYGNPLYVAREKSNWAMRFCFRSSRSFKMLIYDRQSREAFRIERPLSFYGDRAHVYHVETFIGSIDKTIISCVPKFDISDEHGRKIFRITGPFCICNCEVEFTVYTNNGTEIGMIKKRWSGLGRELFTDVDNFGVTFPVDLCIKSKVLLLAATILIDFGYFEN